MKSLQGAASDFEGYGVRVLGISRDAVSLQAKFAKECELKMPLLSDPDGSATAKFDAGMEGRPFPMRVTFIIDPEGKVRLRDDKVQVRSHGADLVAKLADLVDGD